MYFDGVRPDVLRCWDFSSRGRAEPWAADFPVRRRSGNRWGRHAVVRYLVALGARWIAQMGGGRAGCYGWDAIDNGGTAATSVPRAPVGRFHFTQPRTFRAIDQRGWRDAAFCPRIQYLNSASSVPSLR